MNLSAMDAGEIMEAGDQDALMARNGANGQLVRGLEETPAAPLKRAGVLAIGAEKSRKPGPVNPR
ncbi:MAG: hypothetical protein V3S64_01400 [bacterium]